MRLDQLIADLTVRVARGDARRDVRDLTDDSRQASPDCLFIARTGADADGRSFILDAIARGATAVLAESPLPDDLPEHVTLLSADQVDQRLAGLLASRLFGQPHEKLRLIGITGTNGKTTTAWIVRHLLESAGLRCGLIGTVAVDVGEVSRSEFRVSSSDDAPATTTAAPPNSKLKTPNSELPQNTTPGAIEFVRLLSRMVANGCQAAVAEVSSHALHQGRADALRFDAVVFTNLSGDHLDYHQTMAAYAEAKAHLFTLLKPIGRAIVNADDQYAEAMLAAAPEGARVVRCSRLETGSAGDSADIVSDVQRVGATVLHASAEGSDARFDGPWGSMQVMLPLVGPHNVMNTLQAIAAAHAVCDLGSTLRQALTTCPPVPGRLEKVPSSEFRVSSSDDAPVSTTGTPPNSKLPTVLVDYAHTHDALDNVLRALRPLTKGRLIVLFGCGGDRDRTKRPKMARVAQQWADVIFVTSDNPRTEDPQSIIDDITEGFTSSPEAARLKPRCPAPETTPASIPTIHIEPDRARAIRAAIDAGGADDTVLLAGKGHEDYQILGKDKHHFDDREHAAAALARWRSDRSSPASVVETSTPPCQS
ncbi:Mur ligase family protein [Phycisphaerales bacterium AB-hyl4]|uniref:UDP-N-acetylmuramoyl-L-alanyl-D-glutamate--2,6-diaminopimelate ligase n=1 Tax=Natronomicrosphaera hydrolytica TaxID=3242702 RepID=A0ABV4U4M1_9BACT